MDMKFKLEITLGNAQMNDYEDIINALADVQKKLAEHVPESKIRDINGNTVGKYNIIKEV